MPQGRGPTVFVAFLDEAAGVGRSGWIAVPAPARAGLLARSPERPYEVTVGVKTEAACDILVSTHEARTVSLAGGERRDVVLPVDATFARQFCVRDDGGHDASQRRRRICHAGDRQELMSMSQDPLTSAHVRWAYRLLLDRQVESDEAVATKLRAWRTTAELRLDMMASEEFGLKNPEHATTGGATIVIKPLADGTRLFVDLSDHVIGRPIVRDAYEQAEIRCALSVLRAGDVALDIGAHIGFFTMQLARAVGETGHVYAFEPLESNASLLARSIAENGFGSRVTLERQAASDRDGEGHVSVRGAQHQQRRRIPRAEQRRAPGGFQPACANGAPRWLRRSPTGAPRQTRRRGR